MNNRIKKIRKTLNLNQTEFGEKIGVKQGSVAGYESGARVPLDTVVNSICREFNVSKNWLRTGEGEMFVERTRDQEIAAFVASALSDESDSFRRRLLLALSRLDESHWETLAEILENLASEIKKD